MTPSDCPRLFVYGTLRPDAGNAKSAQLYAEASGAGRATLRGVLFEAGVDAETGPYPGLHADPSAPGLVTGYVYDLRAPEATFVWMDEYEAVDRGLYRREVRPVLVEGAGQRDAWVYVFCGQRPGAVVESGDWLRHLATRRDQAPRNTR